MCQHDQQAQISVEACHLFYTIMQSVCGKGGPKPTSALYAKQHVLNIQMKQIPLHNNAIEITPIVLYQLRFHKWITVIEVT